MLARVFVGVCLLHCGVMLAQVRTWVSPAGVDTNPCSLSQPCRNFAAAIDAVNNGGEVVALSSGGFGPVTIDKSVILLAPLGIHAAIAPTAGAAIVVNVAGGDVTLRNLQLNSQGAPDGINAPSVARLSVQDCTIGGFVDGIDFNAGGDSTNLYVLDSTLRNLSGVGITSIGSSAHVTLAGVRILNAGSGVVASSRADIQDTIVAGSENIGFFAFLSASMVFDRSSAINCGTGFRSDNSSKMIITRSTASHNGNGVWATEGVILMSDSTITSNQLGISFAPAGSVVSGQNNTLERNGTDGAFSSTYNAK